MPVFLRRRAGSTEPPTSSFRSLRHPAFRRWAAGDAVSQLGTWGQALALSWVVLELTGSTAALGVALALQSAPQLLLGAWGGALADRLPLRPLVVGTQLAQAGCAAVLALLVWAGTATMPLLFLLALLQGLVQVVDGPAHGLFAQQLVPEEDLPNAAALGSITSSGGRVLGMALAGAALGTIGATWLFLANALTFAAVARLVRRLPAEQVRTLPRAEGDTGSVRAGLRYARGHQPLLVLLALVLVTSSLGRNFTVTTAALVRGPLGGDASAYAICSAAFAVGALVGGLVAARLRQLSVRVVLASAGLAAVGQVLAAGSTSTIMLDALMIPVAGACVVLDTAVGVHLVLDTPAALRGRVLALRGLVSAGAATAGAPLLGTLCELLGPRWTVAGTGLLVLAGVLLAAFALQAIAVRSGSWTGWLRGRSAGLRPSPALG
jgi:MFS family permease